MNAQGLVLWAFSTLSTALLWATPLVALVAAWFWWRSNDKPLCYIALAGACLHMMGKISHLALPNVHWVFLSNIEYVPSGNTSLLEALVYLSFTNIGQCLFAIAVLIHFIRVARRHA